MATIQEGASINLGTVLQARLHGILRPGASLTIPATTMTGALSVPFEIENVRMLSPTRVRIDFERPVNNDAGLQSLLNYKIQNVGGAAPLRILSIDIPNESPVHFVTLNTTPATNGVANYILSVNATELALGPELVIDGNMEASGTVHWTAENATVTKQSGDPSGIGGAQVLQVVDVSSGLADAFQSREFEVGAYRTTGLARSVDGLAAPVMDLKSTFGVTTTLYFGTTSTTWTAFEKDFPLTTLGSEEIQVGVSTVSGHPTAQFDNISIRQWIAISPTGTLITAFDDGTPVSDTPKFFNGLGSVPILLAAIATSPTSGRLVFSETMTDVGDILKSSAYSFDEGLVFVRTDGLNSTVLSFETSEQTEGELYELTFNGVAYSDFLNVMTVPVTTPMLGFISKLPPAPLLNLIMYNFLLKSLRDEDAKNDVLFLKRFLDGPQALWNSIVETIYDIPKLWSTTEAPDKVLPYLKRIVGWTRKYDNITNGLSPLVLRRLIDASASFWKERGPEGSIEDILSLITGARCYVVNWFELRAVADEAQIGEDHLGNDPWILANQEDGGIDPYIYDVRIVDDAGALDRELALNIVKFTRPIGERVNIIYLSFLDLFESDGDNSQWTDVGAVSGGNYRLVPGDGRSITTSQNSSDWNNYVSTWKIRGAGKFRLFFYLVGTGDYYCAEIYTNSGSVPNSAKLYKSVASTETIIGSVGILSSFGITVWDNTFYSFRIEVSNSGGDSNSIRLYLDGEQILGAQDSDQAQGSIGFQSLVGFAELSEVEAFLVPAENDFVDINS